LGQPVKSHIKLIKNACPSAGLLFEKRRSVKKKRNHYKKLRTSFFQRQWLGLRFING